MAEPLFNTINNSFSIGDIISKSNCLNYDSSSNVKSIAAQMTYLDTKVAKNIDMKTINHNATDIDKANYSLKMTGFLLIPDATSIKFRLTNTGPIDMFIGFSTTKVFNVTTEGSKTNFQSRLYKNINKGLFPFYIEKICKTTYYINADTNLFKIEYALNDTTTWLPIDNLVVTCANSTDNNLYINLFVNDMIDQCKNDIRSVKCQNFYTNIEDYVVSNYDKKWGASTVDGQYSDWSDPVDITKCGKQQQKRTRTYISEENGGTPISNPVLELIEPSGKPDKPCYTEDQIKQMWLDETSCSINTLPTELNVNDLRYIENDVDVKTKFGKWKVHTSSTISKQCYDSIIKAGTVIKQQMRVYSKSNTCYLSYNSNQVCLFLNNNTFPTWETATRNTNSTHVTLEANGNFTLWYKSPTESTKIWESYTDGYPGAYIEVGDDGRLSFYSAVGRYIKYYGTKMKELASGKMIEKPKSANVYNDMKIYSPSGNYYLKYQDDSNIIVVQVNGDSVVWKSDTNGKASTHLAMESNGNLVLYDNTTVVWETKTSNYLGAYINIDEVGRLIVYSSSGRYIKYFGPQMTELTASTMIQRPSSSIVYNDMTIYGKEAYLVYQANGVLSLYPNGGRTPIWSSGESNDSTHLKLAEDGNLILYNNDTIVWDTKTSGYIGAKLVIYKTYLMLVVNGTEIIKILNINDKDLTAFYAKNTMYDDKYSSRFIIRNFKGDFYSLPANYYFNNDDCINNPSTCANKCIINGVSNPLCGGDWRVGNDTTVIVSGRSWSRESDKSQLFTKYILPIDKNSYKIGSWVDMKLKDVPTHYMWPKAENGDLAKIVSDSGLPGYKRISHPDINLVKKDFIKDFPYLIAWNDVTGEKVPAFPIFERKDKDTFATEVSNNADVVNYLKTNTSLYNDTIIKFIGATGVYTLHSAFKSAFSNRYSKESLDNISTICNIEDVFNDTNCNSELFNPYKSYLTSMDTYCSSNENIINDDCITYYNKSYTDNRDPNNIKIIVPNKKNKDALRQKLSAYCTHDTCDTICSKYLNSRFSQDICDNMPKPIVVTPTASSPSATTSIIQTPVVTPATTVASLPDVKADTPAASTKAADSSVPADTTNTTAEDSSTSVDTTPTPIVTEIPFYETIPTWVWLFMFAVVVAIIAMAVVKSRQHVVVPVVYPNPPMMNMPRTLPPNAIVPR